MTNIIMRLKIESPTAKVNEETIKPLLVIFRSMIKGFMEEQMPNEKVKMLRVTQTKKNRMNKTVACKVCGKDFKTIMAERKLCTQCIKVARGLTTSTTQSLAQPRQDEIQLNSTEVEFYDGQRYVPL